MKESVPMNINLLNTIKKRKILIVGDAMLDTYFFGEVKRISPEAPVPVFRKVGEKTVLGGAGNVAVNLVAAHQDVSILTAVGKDTAGERLLQLLEDNGIHTELAVSAERKTTVKTRFLADNNQQLIRMDVEDTREIAWTEIQQALAKLEACMQSYDLVVLSDYMKGLLTYDLSQTIIQMAKRHQVRVLVDVKDVRIEKYRGAFILKPNLAELHAATGMPVETETEIVAASQKLQKECLCDYVLTTCGAQGMILVSHETYWKTPAMKQEVFDVTGAGDTAIAYLSAALANELTMQEAVSISNCAAGLQVSKVGTSAIDLMDVSGAYVDMNHHFVGKLLSVEGAVRLRAMYPDQCIVFTNGCFDLLHVGHIRYLRQAAALGDLLVIGLNSDQSVRTLKGEGRPVNCEADRAELLCALPFVDYVIIFDEETPYELIKTVQPDILVKGGDYKPDEVVGRDIVEQRGGRLVLLDYVGGKSTTHIIEHITGGGQNDRDHPPKASGQHPHQI